MDFTSFVRRFVIPIDRRTELATVPIGTGPGSDAGLVGSVQSTVLCEKCAKNVLD